MSRREYFNRNPIMYNIFKEPFSSHYFCFDSENVKQIRENSKNQVGCCYSFPVTRLSTIINSRKGWEKEYNRNVLIKTLHTLSTKNLISFYLQFIKLPKTFLDHPIPQSAPVCSSAFKRSSPNLTFSRISDCIRAS